MLREFWREYFQACGGRLVLWDSALIAFPASGQVPRDELGTQRAAAHPASRGPALPTRQAELEGLGDHRGGAHRDQRPRCRAIGRGGGAGKKNPAGPDEGTGVGQVAKLRANVTLALQLALPAGSSRNRRRSTRWHCRAASRAVSAAAVPGRSAETTQRWSVSSREGQWPYQPPQVPTSSGPAGTPAGLLAPIRVSNQRLHATVRADSSRPGAPHHRAPSRAQKRLSRRRRLGTLPADTGELPQPGPVHRGLWRGDAGTVPWHPDAERGWGDRAGHRHRHRYRLPVDADRDLGRVGADLDFLRGQHGQSGGTPTADYVSGLPGTAHLDADHAEHAAIQPGAGGSGRRCLPFRTDCWPPAAPAAT